MKPKATDQEVLAERPELKGPGRARSLGSPVDYWLQERVEKREAPEDQLSETLSPQS